MSAAGRLLTCLSATVLLLSSDSQAAIVEVGTLASVSAQAVLFDPSLSVDNGCDPAGCVATLTRDGDSVTPESRWSCNPTLGPAGSECTISYTFDESFPIEGLNVAMYQGDTRTRSMEVHIDGDLVTTWTSSGTTSDFEAISISSVPGQTVELHGVLSEDEWLSISEVEILVDDGNESPYEEVEVGTLGAVTVTADLFDTSLSVDGGCDPAGCEGTLTRDGVLTDESRWSCAPELGGAGAMCTISYDLGALHKFSELRLAMYQGTTRTRTVEVYIDTVLATTWTSSGTTDSFESIDLSGFSGEVIDVTGVLSSDEWLSIIEVEIIVLTDEVTSTPAPVDPSVPVTSTTDSGELIVEAGEVSWVDVVYSGSWNSDSRRSADGGCDPIGCREENTRDGSLDPESRWSCQYEESDQERMCTIAYDLGDVRDLYALRVAFHQGDIRTRSIQVYIDDTLVIAEWTSSGTTLDFESIPLEGYLGQTITLVGLLDNTEWISITEVAFDIITDDVPLLGVSAQDRIAVEATASSGDPDPVLDGIISAESSWSCASAGCSITFDLLAPEGVEQLSLVFVEDGDIASNIFDVSIGYTPTGDFTTILTGIPSNKDRELTPQQWKIDRLARYVKIEASSLGSGSLQISEVDIRVSSTVPNRPVATGSSLDTIGLLPLAEGSYDFRTEEEGGCGTDGCKPFYVKDGNPSTFWRCYGDPTRGDSVYDDCSVDIDMVYYRNLKQIRIALPDGAERPTEFRFLGSRPNDQGQGDHEVLSAISSGETDDFETYVFDVFTNHVTISGRFRNMVESISILEVEFLEEPYAENIVPVAYFNDPYGDLGEDATTDGFEWQSSSDDAQDRILGFPFGFFAVVSAVELNFPVGDTYNFDLYVYQDEDADAIILEGFQSANEADFQSFPVDLPVDTAVVEINIMMKGTVGGGGAFRLLDARFIGTPITNPTNSYYVGSTAIESWSIYRYPDFVAEGTADQKAIMGAICAVKKATFDGVDCEGGESTATGTVNLPMGEWHVNGNIFMKSGVFLDGRASIDDSPYTTDILLEEGAAGNTDIAAILVFDGVADARIDDLWIRGLYDPDTSNDESAGVGLGSTCVEINDSQNITALDTWVWYCDGDAVVIRNSNLVSFDAGTYDEEYVAWKIVNSRGTGMLVDTSDAVYIRRYTLDNNGVAGLHIARSNNVTFDATIGSGEAEGEGNIGSLDGQQPIDLIVESSTLVTFNDMRVTSANEPVITVSADSSNVVFNNCGFSSVESGVCVIEAEDPSVVTAVDDELTLEGSCFVKI